MLDLLYSIHIFDRILSDTSCTYIFAYVNQNPNIYCASAFPAICQICIKTIEGHMKLYLQ